MALRKVKQFRFSPQGLSDSLDMTDEFPGACATLQNLIPATSTKNVWACRPADVQLTDFPGFTTPGFVSVFKVIGNLVYGLLATGRTAGKDEPFVYNIVTNTFATLTGVTSGNVPTSPASTGDWTPPTMDMCGSNLVVTHPGFDGVTNFFGWFDVSNPAAPTWNAGNTAGGSAITFTTVPSWVRQFNGRAFFGINPATGQPSVVFTDVLTLKVTNANQALTFGDNLPLTGACPLGLSNQLGGIIQSLMVFKGTSNITQITGDPTTSNLTLNTLNVASGSISPRSIVGTPLGLPFTSPDGMRLLSLDANVSDPIGKAGEGITLPFVFALSPTRINSSCNATVYRVSLKSGTMAGNPWVEYWYDIPRKVWSGPHTFPSSMIDVYQDTFIKAPIAVIGSLWQSFTAPSATTGVVENGTTLQWSMQSSVWSTNDEMRESELAEMFINLGGGVSGLNIFNCTILNSTGNAVNTTTVQYQIASSVWGTAVWGTDVWGSVSSMLPRNVNFNAPVIYNRAAFLIGGVSSNSLLIGDAYINRRSLGYMPNYLGLT